ILNDFQLEANASLVNVLKRKKNLFIKNELESDNTPESKEALLTLEKNFTIVCIPVVIKDNLLGIINLGEKFTSEIYSNEDLDLLSTLANQLAIALENARTYEELSMTYTELEGYKTRLEEKVKEKTAELKETQTQLVHSTKLASIGQLAAGMAHEINTPLFVLNNCLEIFNQGINDLKADLSLSTFNQVHPNLTKFVGTGKNTLQRIQKIVDALLGFSRKNREGLDFIYINEGIDDTLVMLEHLMKDNDINVHKGYEAIEKIEADLQQLNQVFMNLFTNAAHAIKTKREKGDSCGNIWVKTYKNGEYINIIFKDDGIGIPQDIQDQIFDAFFTTKQVGEGMGLGLNISYNIIKNHNGNIEIESKEGEGASFVISLPGRQKN
ncbi:MAG: ATP-binding protein, partial [bacterium]